MKNWNKLIEKVKNVFKKYINSTKLRNYKRNIFLESKTLLNF